MAPRFPAVIFALYFCWQRIISVRPSHPASTCGCQIVGVLCVQVPLASSGCELCRRSEMQTHACMQTHIPAHTGSCAGEVMSAVSLPEVPSHIRPALIIIGRGVRVDPLSVELRAGDPLIHSSGFVWASGLTHLPTPQASARPWSEGRLLFSSNNCS